MIDRREFLQLLGIGGGAVLASATANAQAHNGVLVLGISFADTVTLDPAHEFNYVAPVIVAACYDALTTIAASDFSLEPAVAKSWARTPDGKGWRFTIRENMKFASGNSVTADDVKYSLDRVIYSGDQPAQYVSNVVSINKVDDMTVDVVLQNPAEPILTILACPSFGILEKKVLEQHGGDASPDAKAKDKATEWLNSNSAGTGAYKLVRWDRNSQIFLVANPHYWRGKPPFERVVLRHIPESSVQLLSLQHGDIDAAFNLVPEQVAIVRQSPDLWLKSLVSTDFVYMAVTVDPAMDKNLANKKARAAIGYAIDYDGIEQSLMGGYATRPVSFLPIGVTGSTEELTKEIGFRQDLDKAKALLAEAGLPEGFEFELQYGTGPVTGTTFDVLVQKIQSDLARVNIRVKLRPMDMVSFRSLYAGGRSTAIMFYWNTPAPENELWAAATVERVAKRLHWDPPGSLVSLVHQAAAEQDKTKQIELWRQYQQAMIDEAHIFVLFQPIYQIGIRKSIKQIGLTAAGWQVDMYDVKPV
jgi:peptide/nickel transport system substrate-binding protein